ncbi:Anoctamin-7 [Chytridiales sp. JEL 0842]|nr:Anoctamin-7 [Chytridiales sp. JEL 0842]
MTGIKRPPSKADNVASSSHHVAVAIPHSSHSHSAPTSPAETHELTKPILPPIEGVAGSIRIPYLTSNSRSNSIASNTGSITSWSAALQPGASPLPPLPTSVLTSRTNVKTDQAHAQPTLKPAFSMTSYSDTKMTPEQEEIVAALLEAEAFGKTADHMDLDDMEKIVNVDNDKAFLFSSPVTSGISQIERVGPNGGELSSAVGSPTQTVASLSNDEAETEKESSYLTRHYGPRCVHFAYKEDMALFDEIVTYKSTHPSSTLLTSLAHFQSRPHFDALCKIVYMDSHTHWDAILKYERKFDAEDDEGFHLRARIHFEKELLKYHLILVRERAEDLEALKKGVEDRGVHFIKIMASFDVLCAEAERIKLKMAVTEKFKMIRARLVQKAKKDSTHSFIFNPILNTVRKRPRRQTLGVSSTLSTAPTSPSRPPTKTVPDAKSTSFIAQLQKATHLKFKEEFIQSYKEGHDGSILSFIRYAFALVPHPIEVESDPFKREDLGQFKGAERGVSHYKSSPHPVGINDLILEKVYTDYYALHDGPYEDPEKENEKVDNNRSWLYFNWAVASLAPRKIFAEQPLREIRDYFGEKVAFYFAWLGFYTIWTLLPALVGLCVFIYGLTKSPTWYSPTVFDNALTTPFAFFMAVWSTLFLEFWKRQEATLRTVWDTNELKTEEHRRAQWYGTLLRRSPVTGKVEMHFPSWQRVWRGAVAWGVIGLAIMLMVGFEVGVIMVHARLSEESVFVSSAASSALTVTNIVVITPLYLRLSKYLTDYENHKTEEAYEGQLILKHFLFNFVNNYSYLIYLGILKFFIGTQLQSLGITKSDYCTWDYKTPEEESKSCLKQLTVSMAMIIIGLQFIAQFQAVIVPMITRFLAIRTWKEIKSKRKKNSANLPQDQHLNDDILSKWYQRDELMKKTVQFGFISFFTIGFPLAPLFTFIQNTLEIRFGAYRLVVQSKRPFTTRSQGIGAWFRIMSHVSRISILVNALIVAFASTYFNRVYLGFVPKEYKLGAQLAFVLIFEHVVMFVVYVIDRVVPDMPTNVRRAIQREAYLARLETGEEVDYDEDDEVDLAAVN